MDTPSFYSLLQFPYTQPNKPLILIPPYACCVQFLNVGPPNDYGLIYFIFSPVCDG